MVVYRLCKSRFAHDLSGEGARLYGGRWNKPGIACIYTAGSRALAVLEYTVNVNMDEIPRALSMTAIEIPDALILSCSMAELPGDWNISPASFAAKNFGSALLASGAYAVIKLPSVIIPQEFNFLLNPAHQAAREFHLISAEDFVFDVRIKET